MFLPNSHFGKRLITFFVFAPCSYLSHCAVSHSVPPAGWSAEDRLQNREKLGKTVLSAFGTPVGVFMGSDNLNYKIIIMIL